MFNYFNTVDSPLNQRTEFEYDTRGNLLKLTDALGKITRYEYDQYGRQTAIVFDNGDRAEMGYDNFNRQTTAKDENDNVTQYEYDNFNRLTAIELANNARTKYSYDNLGQLTEIEDALNHSTQFKYDDFGRVVTTILPMEQEDLNVFDNFGFLSSYTDFNGDTINYNYDDFGRLQGKTFSNADIAPVSYTYDPVTSQIVTVTDGRGVTNYDYDLRDRISEITNPDGKSIGYGYDVLNNITSLTTEAGTVEYVYDALSRLDQVKDGSEVLADYDYDAVSNLIQTTRADGTVEVHGYDDRHRLTDIETKNSVGQIMSNFSYTLDAAGNRTRVVEENGRTVDYVYDAVNRLEREKIGEQTIDYTYDLVGNRLTRNDSVGGLTSYTYDDNDRLIEMLSGGVTTEFTYDDNGSMLSRDNGIESVSYDWINDGENRLVGATIDGVNGLSSVEYVYDAEGNRVESVVDGVETNYLVTPGGLSDVLLEYDADGAVTKDFVYGLGLVRSSENGSDSFFHTDGLGSVRMLTDTTGLVSEEFVYDAYGVLLSGDDGGYQFAGERRDGETGLDYLRARYYDPELGRFISKDQFFGFVEDPMSMHDYQYAHANPVNNTDPTGYFTLQEASATVGLLGSLASLSTSIGYVGGAYLSGDSPSGEDLLDMADQWVAGFAHFASFGMSTGIRTNLYGETATQNHSGFLWNMGNLAGAGMSMLMGAKVPDTLSFKMGSSDWLATIYEGVSWGTSAWQTGSNIREGELQWTDTFNLLPFASYGMSSQGVKAFLGTVQAVDGELRDWGQMAVTANFRSRKMGWTSETGAIVFPGTNPPEDVITLWRGVDKSHPGYPDAQKGIARPRGGHSDPEMHNMGDTDSVFTSWTISEKEAEYFATKYTGEGIVLEKEFEVPSKRVYKSPDDFDEKEVLIRGLVTDAKARNFNRSEWY